jgi:hypothetical protein
MLATEERKRRQETEKGTFIHLALLNMKKCLNFSQHEQWTEDAENGMDISSQRIKGRQ